MTALAPAQSGADASASMASRSVSSMRLVVALLIAAVAVVIASRTWADICFWGMNDAECGQIFIAPLAFIWILWARWRGTIVSPGVESGAGTAPRKALLGGQRPPYGAAAPSLAGTRWDFTGPLLFALGWAAWAYGFYRGHDLAWHGGALLMVIGAGVTPLGTRFLIRFWPALAVLLFVLPVSGIGRLYVSLPLQSLTAAATQEVCEALGMDVLRLGNILKINGHEMLIAEACNGLRMVWPLFLISWLFAFVTPMRRSLRVIVLLGAPLLAVTANVVRLVPTVWVYGHYAASTASVFHEAAGWAMLVGSFVALIGLSKWFPPKPAAAIPSSSPARCFRAPLGPAVVTAVLLLGAAATAWTMPTPANADAYYTAVNEAGQHVPMDIALWQGCDVPPLEGTEAILAPNLLISRQYVNRISQQKASVLLLQVKDPRGLQWHHPMICYRAHGWELATRNPGQWVVSGEILNGAEYEFYRGGLRRSADIVVCDIMLLPDGTTTSDIEVVTHHARRFAERIFGAAHLQIVCDASIAPQDRHRMVEEILGGYLPLMRKIFIRNAPSRP